MTNTLNALALEPNVPSVAGEIIDGEAIILHLPKGHYFSSEGSGAFIWSGIERKLPLEEIGRGLSAIYGLDAATAGAVLQDFADELKRHELVRECEPSTGSWTDLDQPSGGFVAPAIEVYTDMQHLLLLDPIHDVDTVGWPVAPDRGA